MKYQYGVEYDVVNGKKPDLPDNTEVEVIDSCHPHDWTFPARLDNFKWGKVEAFGCQIRRFRIVDPTSHSSA